MKREFESSHDVRQAFHESVVFDKKCQEFVWLRTSEKEVISYSLKTGDSINSTKADDFDFTLELPLGFCNVPHDDEGLLFLRRNPKKQFKFGLTQNNVEAIRFPRPIDPRRGPRFDIFEPNVIVQTLENKFPTFELVQQFARDTEEPFGLAFHRSLAVIRDEDGLEKLMYKNHTAGWRIPRQKHFVLSDRFSHSEIFQTISEEGGVKEFCCNG